MNYDAKFAKFDDDYHANYAEAFPIAVFGTLRKLPCDQGNLHRMLKRKPIAHKKAFIPHILPSNIWVDFKEGASGLFEVFYYTDDDFKEVIIGVDRLESFTPDHHYGYHRTLLNARLLPDDYPEDDFNKGISWSHRTLGIPQNEWKDFDTVPAWAYSNAGTNEKLAEMENSPLLWWH